MRFYIAHFFVLRNSLLAVGVAKRSSLRISGVKFTWNAPWKNASEKKTGINSFKMSIEIKVYWMARVSIK